MAKKYSEITSIGHGGTSQMFRARQTVNEGLAREDQGREVALKVLDMRNPRISEELFLMEVEALEKLKGVEGVV